MTDETTLQAQASALRAQLSEIEGQLAQVKANSQKAALARIEEIQQQIKTLMTEAEELVNSTGLGPFYPSSFISRLELGTNGYWGADHYWQNSDVNC